MLWLSLGTAVLLWAVPLLYTVSGYLHSAHDFSRLVQVSLLLVMGICWASRQGGPSLLPGAQPVPRTLGRVWWTGVLILVTASTVQSAYPLIACRELVVFSGIWLTALVIAHGVTSPGILQRVLRILVMGGFLYAAAVVLILGATLLEGTLADPWTALMGFDNPRFLNHSQTIALPLVAAVSAGDEQPRWRRLGWWTLFLSGMLLFITFGRATLMALFLGLVTGWWTFGRRGRTYAKRTLTPALLGLATMWMCYLLWMQPAGYTIDPRSLVSPHFRDYLIAESVKLWWTSPWLGVGPMHFAHWYNGEAAHPHDIYFQLLAEYGAPATVLLVGGAVMWLKQVHRRLRAVQDHEVSLAMGLWGALLGIAVDGALSGNFVMPVPQLWIAMALGLTSAFLQRGRSTETGSTTIPIARRPVRLVMGWLIVAALLWLAIQSFREGATASNPAIDTEGPVGNLDKRTPQPNPRFWSNGWF